MAEPSTPRPGAPSTTNAGQGAQEIDLQKLADKVYHLFQEELRLARLRGEPARRGRK